MTDPTRTATVPVIGVRGNAKTSSPFNRGLMLCYLPGLQQTGLQIRDRSGHGHHITGFDAFYDSDGNADDDKVGWERNRANGKTGFGFRTTRLAAGERSKVLSRDLTFNKGPKSLSLVWSGLEFGGQSRYGFMALARNGIINSHSLLFEYDGEVLARVVDINGATLHNASFSSSLLPSNEYFTLALTYDLATTTLKLWLNGKEMDSNGSASLVGLNDSDPRLTLNSLTTSSSDYRANATCVAARVYDRALGQRELSELHRNPFVGHREKQRTIVRTEASREISARNFGVKHEPKAKPYPLKKGLIHALDAAQSSGFRVHDLSGHRRHGQVKHITSGTLSPGRIRAHFHPRTSAAIGVPDLDVRGMPAVSVAYCARMPEALATTTFIPFGITESGSGVGTTFQSFWDGNDIRVRMDNTTETLLLDGPDKASFNYQPDRYFSVVMTYDGERLRYYLHDGEISWSVASLPSSGTVDVNSAGWAWMGRLDGADGSFFSAASGGATYNHGYWMDYMRVWDRELSYEETLEYHRNPAFETGARRIVSGIHRRTLNAGGLLRRNV